MLGGEGETGGACVDDSDPSFIFVSEYFSAAKGEAEEEELVVGDDGGEEGLRLAPLYAVEGRWAEGGG
jgi:hypothetical protein